MISSAALDRQFLDKKGKGDFYYLHVIAITLLLRGLKYFIYTRVSEKGKNFLFHYFISRRLKKYCYFIN